MASLPCFLCGKSLALRADRNGKSYFICDPCGVQCFIRRAAGLERLERLTADLAKRAAIFERGGRTLYEVQSILAEVDGLRAEIKRLDPVTGWLTGDEKSIRAKQALQKRVDRLIQQLERLP